MIKIVVLLISFVVTRATTARAEPLTVERVIANLPFHPLATAARAGIARADGERTAAAGAFDVRVRARGDHAPIGYYDRLILDGEVRTLTRFQGLSAFAGWRLGAGGIPDYDLKLATLDRGEWRAGIDLPLLRDRAIDRARADERKAETSRAVARAELTRRQLELARDAIVAYWDWVTAGHRLVIRARQLELARTRDRGLQRTIGEGNMAPIEGVDNARVIAQREALVIAAERDARRAALELSLWYRDPRGDSIVPEIDELPILRELTSPLPEESDVGAAVAAARLRQPIAAAFSARLAANAIDRELAENQRLPSLGATAYGSRGIGGLDPRLPDRSSTAINVGFSFELPLQRRQAEGALAIARADRQRLEAEQRFAFERLELDVRVAVAELTAARGRAVLAGEQERLARQLAEAEQQRFDRGDTTILVVNLREEAAAEAAAARVDALGEYWKARVRFQVALGQAPRL
jgi:cobalt-zinc-cadmium efflux system outer membrane protein